MSKSVCTNPMQNVLATRPGTFTKPLGLWPPRSDPCSPPRWKSYFSHSSQQRLFQPDPQRPSHYKQLSTKTRLAFSLVLYNTRIVQQSIHESYLYRATVPVQPALSGHQLRVNRPLTPTILEPEPGPVIDSFSAYISSLATWKRGLLQGAFQSNDTQSLAQYLV